MWTIWGKLPVQSPSPQVSIIRPTLEAVHNYSLEQRGVACSRVSPVSVRFVTVMAM